jgi:hypothetical protein
MFWDESVAPAPRSPLQAGVKEGWPGSVSHSCSAVPRENPLRLDSTFVNRDMSGRLLKAPRWVLTGLGLAASRCVDPCSLVRHLGARSHRPDQPVIDRLLVRGPEWSRRLSFRNGLRFLCNRESMASFFLRQEEAKENGALRHHHGNGTRAFGSAEWLGKSNGNGRCPRSETGSVTARTACKSEYEVGQWLSSASKRGHERACIPSDIRSSECRAPRWLRRTWGVCMKLLFTRALQAVTRLESGVDPWHGSSLGACRWGGPDAEGGFDQGAVTGRDIGCRGLVGCCQKREPEPPRTSVQR